MEEAGDRSFIDMRDHVVRLQARFFRRPVNGHDDVLRGVIISVAVKDFHSAQREAETARSAMDDDRRPQIVLDRVDGRESERRVGL